MCPLVFFDISRAFTSFPLLLLFYLVSFLLFPFFFIFSSLSHPATITDHSPITNEQGLVNNKIVPWTTHW